MKHSLLAVAGLALAAQAIAQSGPRLLTPVGTRAAVSEHNSAAPIVADASGVDNTNSAISSELLETHAGTSVTMSKDGDTETAVAFFNDCLDRPTHISPPDSRHNVVFSRMGDISLRVKARGARPNARIWLKAEIGPTGYATVPVKNEVIEKTLVADSKGEFEVRLDPRTSKWKKFGDPSVVAAKVIWAEKDVSNAHGGGGSASIATPRKDVAYRVKDTPLCYWQTPVAIASKYVFNANHGANMLFKREEEMKTLKAHQFGMGFGIGNYFTINRRGQGPFGPSISGFSSPYVNTLPGPWPLEIWVLINTTSTRGTRTNAKIEQNWSLLPLDGGFFGQRFSVTRFAAEEYVPDTKSACGEWKLKREGVLDVGISATTLYSVPNYLQGKPDEAREFMDRIHPPLNTCPVEVDNRRFDIKAPEGDFLFFYPN